MRIIQLDEIGGTDTCSCELLPGSDKSGAQLAVAKRGRSVAVPPLAPTTPHMRRVDQLFQAIRPSENPPDPKSLKVKENDGIRNQSGTRLESLLLLMISRIGGSLIGDKLMRAVLPICPFEQDN